MTYHCFEYELVTRLSKKGIKCEKIQRDPNNKYNYVFAARRTHEHRISVSYVWKGEKTMMHVIVQGYKTLSESTHAKCVYHYERFNGMDIWKDMERAFGTMDKLIEFIVDHIVQREG